MAVVVTEKVMIGEIIKIEIAASHKTSITIQIIDPSGNVKDDTLSCNTTKEFICETYWTVPQETLPGTYIVKVNDAISSNQTTFEVLPN